MAKLALSRLCKPSHPALQKVYFIAGLDRCERLGNLKLGECGAQSLSGLLAGWQSEWVLATSLWDERGDHKGSLIPTQDARFLGIAEPKRVTPALVLESVRWDSHVDSSVSNNLEHRLPMAPGVLQRSFSRAQT
jgi:hypothetical protein